MVLSLSAIPPSHDFSHGNSIALHVQPLDLCQEDSGSALAA